MQKKSTIHRPFLIATLILTIMVASPLLTSAGLLNTRGGGDSPFLLQRLHQLAVALGDGHFPVRWMPAANYGYGYPFFHYYAPLSTYVAWLFVKLGFGYVTAVQLAQIAGFITAAVGAYRLGQRWLGNPWAALLASVAYTTAPFHMVNVFVRGDSLAEFWAMALYPWVLLAVDALFAPRPAHTWRSRLHPTLGLALIYAALILTHNISALLFTPFVALYGALHVLLPTPPADQRPISKRKKNKNKHAPSLLARPLVCAVLATALALMLSAWFWLPALIEKSLVQLAPVTEGYFHYSNHFRGRDLVQTTFIFNYDVAGGQAFRMGLLQLVLGIAGLTALLRGWMRGKKHPTLVRIRLTVLLGILVSTVMITPLSRSLWAHLPLLDFTQFPWRFLSAQALFLALATGAIGLLPKRKLLVPVATLLLLFAAMGDLSTDYLPLSDEDVTAEALAQYEWFTGNIGTTVSAEYLPTAVHPRPVTSPWLEAGDRDFVDTTGTAELVARHTAAQTWTLTAESAHEATFPLLYWEGWEATIDGEPAVLRSAAGTGLAQLDVPTGTHTVALTLGRTPIRQTAETLSVVALFVVLAFWVLGGDIRPTPRQAMRFTLRLILVALVMLVVRVWPSQAYETESLTQSWDFDQRGYLHHAPQGILFEGEEQLRSYTYSAEQVAGGETLTLSFDMALGQSESLRVALTTPAVHRHPQAPPLVERTVPLVAGATEVSLAIPDHAPPGLYVPMVTLLPESRALTGHGQTRGALFLRPVRVLAGEATAGRETSSRPWDVAVQALTATPDALQAQLAWWFEVAPAIPVGVSMRLVDANGVWVAQKDVSAGYGFAASEAWRGGAWHEDWLALPLPQEPRLPAGEYTWVVQAYAPHSGAVWLTRKLANVMLPAERGGTPEVEPHVPQMAWPEGAGQRPEAVWEAHIALRDYAVEEEGDLLTVTLLWEATADGERDYTRFVHVRGAEEGAIRAQSDTAPQFGTYSTEQWVQGEYVTDVVVIPLGDAAGQANEIAVGFYEVLPEGGDSRVALVGGGDHFVLRP